MYIIPSLASRQIDILLNEGNIKEALTICEAFPGESIIESQRINILFNTGKIKEALAICNKFPNDQIIASQKIKILINENKLEEALNLCDKFRDYLPIISQKITILIMLNAWDIAIDLCNQYEEEPSIASQKINILIQKQEFDDALIICNKFPNYYQIRTQKLKIYHLINQNHIILTDERNLFDYYLYEIKTGYASLSTLQNLPLNSTLKCIITFAYYTTINYPEQAILHYLKKNIHVLSPNILKQLMSHLKQKNKIINNSFANKIFDLYLEHTKEDKQNKSL